MNRLGRFGSKKQKDSSDSSPPPPPPPPESTQNNSKQGSQIAASEYAKATIQLNRRIAALGAGFEFDFPRVAVVGAQSSGKSSLVEAISGICVPRYSNTCTRCPTECTMIPDGSDSWYCTINLKITANGVTSSQRFGPERITEKEEVELWLTRAQAAILSPDRQMEFRDLDAEALRRIMKDDDRFSNNVIEVEVRDPDLPPLTFIDLPGLIQHHSKSNEMIDVVDKMVRSFIGGARRNNTLMLIVMPANEDANNQKAMNLAKEYDRNGARTIGVLTKPDQIGEGDHGLKESAKEALEGQGDHRLRNGYYCVRLPNDAERKQKLGPDELSSRANNLFNETEPWKDVTNRSVFGVSNLVSSISALLVNIIRANLPKLEKQIKEKLASCQAELQRLPLPPTGKPLILLMDLIRLFSEDVSKAVMGHEHRQYAQQNRRDIYAKFRANVWRTGINFNPYIYPNDTNVIRAMENREEPWNHSSIPEPERVNMPEFSMSMDLKEATVELVQRSTSQWREPAMNCFNEVFEQSRRLFDGMIGERFEQYDALKQLVKSITHEHHEACKEDAAILLEKSVRLETNPLYTQNYHYYNSQRVKWRSQFASALTKSLHPHYVSQVQDYQSELELMGDARAYFKVAFKRFADYIPLLIEHELSQEFAGHLYERLVENIPLNDAKKLEEFMAERPAIRLKREQLQTDISRLNEMVQLLEEYKQHGSPDVIENSDEEYEDPEPGPGPTPGPLPSSPGDGLESEYCYDDLPREVIPSRSSSAAQSKISIPYVAEVSVPYATEVSVPYAAERAPQRAVYQNSTGYRGY
ncbi:hypothetical protein VNI00_014045 [Paramarasmius palmivorus]|uniref:Uncharacterized protein n=1 Tax=Paramarasmius palmivorus TaxID=297713 RepID=A0AAW0BT85_9AGAR